MSDQENPNQNEEEYYEENMMNMNQNENENQEDEEGQDIYAFDIQINEDSYLLVIGKTEDNKILLRLIDKEDQTKPFFQNEFSLNDLRNINPIFNDIDNEDIAFQYLISSLNNSEKEIKIIDDNQIKFIIYLVIDDEKIETEFLLFKTIDDGENENEGEGEGEEEMMEEGIEMVNEDINKNDSAKKEKLDENIISQKDKEDNQIQETENKEDNNKNKIIKDLNINAANTNVTNAIENKENKYNK